MGEGVPYFGDFAGLRVRLGPECLVLSSLSATSMCVCVYVCMYVYMCMYMCVCMHAYVYVYLCMYSRKQAFEYGRVGVRILSNHPLKAQHTGTSSKHKFYSKNTLDTSACEGAGAMMYDKSALPAPTTMAERRSIADMAT